MEQSKHEKYDKRAKRYPKRGLYAREDSIDKLIQYNISFFNHFDSHKLL